MSQCMQVEQLNLEGWARRYLLYCKDPLKSALIDPIWENLESNLAHIESMDLSLEMVIGTHTHADHISAGWLIAERLGCDFVMLSNALTYGVTRQVNDMEDLDLGSIKFSFHATPGHTTDSMIVEIPGAIFTGDFLFNGDGGVGRDDLPGGDIAEHWNSLQKLERFSQDVLVYSGHEPPGALPRSLEWNRENNPVLRLSTIEEYESWQRSEWQRLGKVRMIDRALPANCSGNLPTQ